MTQIKSLLFTIVALFGLTTVAQAISLNGIYFEVGGAAVGVEMDGSHNDNDSDISKGTVGKTAVTGSYGLGWMTSRENKLGLDFGYMVTPGAAKIKATSDDANTDITFEVSDSSEYYIAPMLNISEDASLYFKYGWSEADVTVTGDIKNPGDLDGSTVALGTVMSWGSNMYIRTEAGISDYDQLTATGKGTAGGIGTDVSVTADPTVHYGRISIGYKF
jgi:hypothetical protein